MYRNVKLQPYFYFMLSNYNECVQRTNQTGIENYVPCVCVVPYHFEHTDLNLNGWETTNRYA